MKDFNSNFIPLYGGEKRKTLIKGLDLSCYILFYPQALSLHPEPGPLIQGTLIQGQKGLT